MSPAKNHWRTEGIFFMGILYRAIKRKMWSSRREDPEVRIELPRESDVFSCDLGRATKSNFQQGKKVYHVQKHRLLDDILGSKWDVILIQMAIEAVTITRCFYGVKFNFPWNFRT